MLSIVGQRDCKDNVNFLACIGPPIFIYASWNVSNLAMTGSRIVDITPQPGGEREKACVVL